MAFSRSHLDLFISFALLDWMKEMENTDKKHHIHVLPLSVYIGVGTALFVLTGVTIAATYVDLGGTGNLILAMLIATVKASLVVLFFMHLL